MINLLKSMSDTPFISDKSWDHDEFIPDYISVFSDGIVGYPTDSTFSKTTYEGVLWWDDNSNWITWWTETKLIYQVFAIDEIDQIYNRLFDLYQMDPQEFNKQLQTYTAEELATLLDSSNQELSVTLSDNPRYDLIEAFQWSINDHIDKLIDKNEFDNEVVNKDIDALNRLIEWIQEYDRESDEGVNAVKQFIQSHSEIIKSLPDLQKNEFVEYIEEYFPYNIHFLKKLLTV